MAIFKPTILVDFFADEMSRENRLSFADFLNGLTDLFFPKLKRKETPQSLQSLIYCEEKDIWCALQHDDKKEYPSGSFAVVKDVRAFKVIKDDEYDLQKVVAQDGVVKIFREYDSSAIIAQKKMGKALFRN